MRPIEILNEQIRGFISNNKDDAIAYLKALSENGIVKFDDIGCDEKRLKELNNSAKEFSLVDDENKASALMKRDLHNYLSGKNKSEYSDESEDKIKDNSIYNIHKRAADFIAKANTENDAKASADYLAVLSIKGEVQASDLKGVGIFSFIGLNHKANSLGLIYPGYTPAGKVRVSPETKEALRTFLVEGNLDTRYSAEFQESLRESYERNLKIIGYNPEMEKKGWQAILDSTDEAAIIKHYLQVRAEKGLKEFPNIKVNLNYGMPTKGDDWKELSFFISFSGYPKEKNGEPKLEYLAKVKKIADDLKQVFPESDRSEMRVRMDKESNGINVYGSPTELAASIKSKDELGWNNSARQQSVSSRQGKWWR